VSTHILLDVQDVQSSLITLMMKVVQTSEMLVNLYQSTLPYNPEDSHLQTKKLVYMLKQTKIKCVTI
jgi:hypothetical protein